jgi:hypothetical protein
VKRTASLVIAMLLAALLPCRASAQSGTHDAFRSFALVIGAGKYLNVPPLVNSRNDAIAMASTLRDLGFDVVSVIDGDRDTVEREIAVFLDRLASADRLHLLRRTRRAPRCQLFHTNRCKGRRESGLFTRIHLGLPLAG